MAACCPPDRCARRLPFSYGTLMFCSSLARARPPNRWSAPLPAPAAAPLRGHLGPPRFAEWRKDPILAFAGIGHPEKFFATLAAAHAPVVRTVSFSDHHRYTDAEAAELIAAAEAKNLRLVTTEKDRSASPAGTARPARCTTRRKP